MYTSPNEPHFQDHHLSFKLTKKSFFLITAQTLTTKMGLTYEEAQAIEAWIPPPSSPSPPVAPPVTEQFLVRSDFLAFEDDSNDSGKGRWPGSPTPSDSLSQAFRKRTGLSSLNDGDLAEGRSYLSVSSLLQLADRQTPQWLVTSSYPTSPPTSPRGRHPSKSSRGS